MITPTLILPWTAHLSRRVTSLEFGLFVPPEALFPNLEATEESLAALLSTLSRDAVLLACARLNTVVSGTGYTDHKPRQERATGMVCTEDDLRRINNFAKTHPGSGLPIVFFRGQLLELMRFAVRYCPDTPDDGTVFDGPAARARLLQAALIASALWGRRVYADRLSSELPVDAARMRALGAFRRGLEESVIAPHVGVSLGRGWALFAEHFPRRYPTFEADFLEVTELTIEQYFTCVAGLTNYLPFDRADGPIFDVRSVANATAYRKIFEKYFALESQTPDQLTTSLRGEFTAGSYLALRERPILVLPNGRAVILDATFYCERLSIGPLFHLTARVRRDRGRSLALFSAFGEAFEDYTNSILRRMYPDRPLLVSRLCAPLVGRDDAGNNFEIDAVLNDAVHLVLFEMKAAWLKDEIVLDDFEKWLEQIRSRYGVVTLSAEGKQERPKGVAQLARLARRVLDGRCGTAQSAFAAANVIHPVLLVHDARLNAPAYGTFLANEFTTLLGSVPPGKKVMPLTVMTIGDLENLESSIDQFSLRQLLSDYAAACPDGLRSLHNFMVTSANYADKLKPSAPLMENSQRLMRLVRRELFPQSLKVD